VTNNTKLIAIIACISCSILSSCGGGGSSDSGLVVSGTLTEAGGATHSNSLALRHSDNEGIEDVEICALGECSTTDSQGLWGFVAGEDFVGGDVLFETNGHGISAMTVINIPEGAKEVVLDLRHIEGGEIKAEHVTIDGETSHNEAEGHQHD
jgi:hypothetical protein